MCVFLCTFAAQRCCEHFMPRKLRHMAMLFLLIFSGLFGVCQGVSAGYNILVRSNPSDFGKVQVGSNTPTTNSSYYFASATTVTIKAIPNTGYKFVNWIGGYSGTSSTISIPVASYAGKVFQANFTIQTYTITFKNADGTQLQSLTVKHGETPTYTGSTPTKAADAQYTYTFDGWDPEIVAATKDAVYTATYTSKVRKYTITVKSADADQGSVSGGGTYNYGSSVTLTATAKGCYRFKKWSDGSTLNPRIVTVTGEKTYTAQFEDNTTSGTYGPDNIEWSFDYCDSTLSITGNGELRCDNNTWGPNGGGINPNLVKRAFVGKGVTYLGIYTLSYMSNIEYIEVEDGHPTHRTGCNAIIRIGTEQEGDTLIFGCPHTVIPTTCTTIRGYAFWDDHLVTEMTIPSSVRQIANMQGSLWQGNNGNVFYTSNNTGEGLKDLYVEWTKLEDIPEVLNNKLGDMTKVRLHVPCGTTALYKQVTGWKNFKEYIEEATSYTVTVQTATGDESMGTVSIMVP